MNPTATLDRDTVRLSDSVRVTLSVEGDPPLRVVLPKEPLDVASAAVWRVWPVGSPVRTALSDGRQKWSLTYRADPYTPGDAVQLTFAPVQVFGGTELQPRVVAWPALTVRVVTGISSDARVEVRPVTGVEAVLDPPKRIPIPVYGSVILVGVGLLAAIALVVRKLHRRPAPIAPADQAEAALDDLLGTDIPADVFAVRLTGVLREFVTQMSDIPASTLTGAELAHALEVAGVWSADAVVGLRFVLGDCDAAKFAGSPLPDGTRRKMIEAVREFVCGAPTRLPRPEEPSRCDSMPPAAGS